MTSMPPPQESGGAPVFRPRRTPLSRTLLALTLGIAAAAGVGAYVRLRPGALDPPAVPARADDQEVRQAVEEGRAAVQQSPRSADAWGRLGMVFLAHYFLAEAAACFTQAEHLDPGEPRWAYCHALALSPEDSDAAMAKLRQAVELWDDVDDTPRLWLGEMLLERGRLDEAEGHFRQALRRNPDQLRGNLGLGRLALERGDLKTAVPFLLRAAESPHARRAARGLLAEAYRRLGDSARAERLTREVARLDADPHWPDPMQDEVEAVKVGKTNRQERAIKLLQQKRVAEAEAVLQGIVRDYADSELAYTHLARIWIEQNRPSAAEHALRTALKRTPDSVSAHLLLGILLWQQGKAAAAIPHLREVARRKPADPWGHYHLGHCLLREGDWAGARAAFRAAVQAKPDLLEAHLSLGEVCADSGLWAEAVAHLRSASALDPAHERVARLTARVAARMALPGPF